MTDQPASKWWYLLPIILGIIGGLIGWLRFRKSNPRRARNMIIVGFGLTLVDWIILDYFEKPWIVPFSGRGVTAFSTI